MKYILILAVILISFETNSQIISGEYNSEMKIAYNPSSKLLTGYFESYTGYDENTGSAKFSCVFYFYGIVKGKNAEIKSLYPNSNENDIIKGNLVVTDSVNLKLKLVEEHGGCWNVAHFADEFVDLKLSSKSYWIEIRYIASDKSYFYKEKTESSKRKAYIVKGDLVYIDIIEKDWVHCKYYGKSITEGWIKKETLNK